MQDTEFVDIYFNQFSDIKQSMLETNRSYFEGLLRSYRRAARVDLKMWEPGDSLDECCLPFALIPNEKRENVTEYSDLSADFKALINFDLVLCKMHAGLGTSVERKTHMNKYTDREELGSKGTDLFIEIRDKAYSLAELQFVQVEKIINSKVFNSVRILNMVNLETRSEVEKIEKKYSFQKSKNTCERMISQLRVPTVNELNELTDERTAPAGHGLVGFDLLLDIYSNPARNELISIGNGEDLNSTADKRILSWMVEKEIPIVMITTTKIESDKKGGQISRCIENEKNHYTIVEKAQAEVAGQLQYFEELGLRDSDYTSLFNTNIVVLNTKVLKQKFELADIDLDRFKDVLTPTVIKNNKIQNAKNYIQLEGALGSVILNLDKFFRKECGVGLVHFLNLNPIEREEFFIPIKKFKDFEELKEKYHYCDETGRFIKN